MAVVLEGLVDGVNLRRKALFFEKKKQKTFALLLFSRNQPSAIGRRLDGA
jgi:hypothetical protein